MFQRKHLSICDSTNHIALAWAKAGAGHKSLVTCEQQTLGRGRQGRSWLHDLGGLAFSFILRPQINPNQAAPITLVTAVALSQSLRALHLETLIKWPNDVLLPDTQKCAGILTEAYSTGSHLDAIIIGIGLNVQRLDNSPAEYGFLSDIGYLGTKTELFEAILDTFEFHFDRFTDPKHVEFCLAYFKKYSATLGKPVPNGIAVDINSDGSLLVQNSAGDLSSVYTIE